MLVVTPAPLCDQPFPVPVSALIQRDGFEPGAKGTTVSVILKARQFDEQRREDILNQIDGIFFGQSRPLDPTKQERRIQHDKTFPRVTIFPAADALQKSERCGSHVNPQPREFDTERRPDSRTAIKPLQRGSVRRRFCVKVVPWQPLSKQTEQRFASRERAGKAIAAQPQIKRHSQRMEDGRTQVLRADRPIFHIRTVFVRLAINGTTTDASASDNRGKARRPMLTSRIHSRGVDDRCATEFSDNHHERTLQHASFFEVGEQCRKSFVELG